MRVLLAPMEGVLDSLVRELLTEVNDYDSCITEFLRVVDCPLPVKSFQKLCPELHHKPFRHPRAHPAVRAIPAMAGKCRSCGRADRGALIQLRLPIEDGQRQRRRGHAA